MASASLLRCSVKALPPIRKLAHFGPNAEIGLQAVLNYAPNMSPKLAYQCGPIGPKGEPVGELRVGGEHRRQPIAELLRLWKKNERQARARKDRADRRRALGGRMAICLMRHCQARNSSRKGGGSPCHLFPDRKNYFV